MMMLRAVGDFFSMRSIARGKRLLVLAILLSLVSSGKTLRAQQVADHGALVKAQAALDSNQPQQAIEILNQTLKTHAGDDSAHLLLAEAFAMSGKVPEAVAQYELILKRAPNDYVALAGLGELYLSTGELEKAEPLLARSVKNSRHEPQLRIEWAQVLTRLHRFKEASAALASVAIPSDAEQKIDFFRLKAAIAEGLHDPAAAASDMERALAIHPEDVSLQLATAMAHMEAGDWGRAATLAEAAFARTKDPDAGLTLLQAQLKSRANIRQTLASLRSLALPADREIALRQRLAQILISSGDFSEAVKDFARVVEFEPGNPEFQFNLALAQFKAGDGQSALATAERLKQRKDTADVEALLGDIQESLGDNLAAVKSYQRAAELSPDEDHQLALALEFIRHRNFEPAKLVLLHAEQAFPESWRVRVALGIVQYFVGTKQEASQILLRAADLAPQPDLALRYLGEIELDESAAPDVPAVDRLCRYANEHPKAAREQMYCGALMLHRDYALQDRSHVDDMIRRLTIAAQELPHEATPHCELGRAYAWLEKWSPAQQQAEICVKLNPDSAQAHYRLSQIYHHTGQTERAREEIKLYKEASERLAETNEQHETTLKTFLYTIQNQATGTK